MKGASGKSWQQAEFDQYMEACFNTMAADICHLCMDCDKQLFFSNLFFVICSLQATGKKHKKNKGIKKRERQQNWRGRPQQEYAPAQVAPLWQTNPDQHSSVIIEELPEGFGGLFILFSSDMWNYM